MVNVFYAIFSSLIVGLTIVYIWSKILNLNIDFRNSRTISVIILFCAAISVNYIFSPDSIRLIIITFIQMFFCKFLTKESFKRAIITSFVGQIIFFIAEFIFVLILLCFMQIVNPNSVVNSAYGFLGTNTVISSLVLIITKTKIPNKMFKYIIQVTDLIMGNQIIFLGLLIIISINVLFVSTYYEIDQNALIITNIIITIFYVVIVVRTAIYQNKYMNITNKYNTTITSLKEYEDILDKYKITNHENKNQLLVIRAMSIKKDQGLPKYIDSLIEDKIKDNEKLMFDTGKIPNGGLRGLIYSKMLAMQEKKINFALNIDNEVRTIDLIEIGDANIVEICKIIGVFLDNAIEAVENLEEKNIVIGMYKNDSVFSISIANNYIGQLEINKFENNGYTTKGKNHGYGLSLVKKIVNENEKFTNTKKIDKNTFTQILNIQI